jgi:hypothetical protein
LKKSSPVQAESKALFLPSPPPLPAGKGNDIQKRNDAARPIGMLCLSFGSSCASRICWRGGSNDLSNIRCDAHKFLIHGFDCVFVKRKTKKNNLKEKTLMGSTATPLAKAIHPFCSDSRCFKIESQTCQGVKEKLKQLAEDGELVCIVGFLAAGWFGI